MEEAVSKCLLKKFGRSVPLPLSHFTDSSRLFSHSTGIAPVHGALLASGRDSTKKGDRRADLSRSMNYACGHFQSTFYVL